jgi:hypothetical protein
LLYTSDNSKKLKSLIPSGLVMELPSKRYWLDDGKNEAVEPWFKNLVGEVRFTYPGFSLACLFGLTYFPHCFSSSIWTRGSFLSAYMTLFPDTNSLLTQLYSQRSWPWLVLYRPFSLLSP